jgi:hypothetical protein
MEPAFYMPSDKKIPGPIRASGQENPRNTCFWAGKYVLLGRSIRASGQEHTCLWAGTYVFLGRISFVTRYAIRIFLAITL